MLGDIYNSSPTTKFDADGYREAVQEVKKDSVLIKEKVASLQDTVSFINELPEKFFDVVLLIADRQFVENIRPILLLDRYVGESHQGVELKAAIEKISVLRFLFHSAYRYAKSEFDRMETELEVWYAKKRVSVHNKLSESRKVMLKDKQITASNSIPPSHEIEAAILDEYGDEVLKKKEEIRRFEMLYENLKETNDILEKRGSHLQTLINSEIGMIKRPE
jgi:hypothetical protein